MKSLKRLLYALILLLCLFMGLWLTQDNPQAVTVTLLGFSLPPLALGLWLVIALVGGVVLGMAASLPRLLRLNRRLRRERQPSTPSPR